MTTTEPTPEDETPEEEKVQHPPSESPSETDPETARQSETEANRAGENPMMDRNPEVDPPFQPST